MPAHFRNREHQFWSHQRDLSLEEQRTAAALVRGSVVQEAIDHLEHLLPPEQRSSVACTIVILDEPSAENVVIELQGPAGFLEQIRARVAPDLTIAHPDGLHTDSHFLQVPKASVSVLADEADPYSQPPPTSTSPLHAEGTPR